jgi:hypothetical protein
MHRIDNATAAATLPTPDAAGTAGYFTKGNPGTGTPATVMDQDWFNAVQEEPLAVMAAASITPVKGTNNQLLAALRVLFGGTGSLTGTGYMRLPGGLIIQWGLANIVASPIDITLPIAFPTNHLQSFAVDSGGGLLLFASQPITASQIRIWTNDTAAGVARFFCLGS